jgi:hypothetical protein
LLSPQSAQIAWKLQIEGWREDSNENTASLAFPALKCPAICSKAPLGLVLSGFSKF